MLTVTTQAASAIKGLIEKSEVEDGGLRIHAQPVDESQATLELSLTTDPQPGDKVVASQGAEVYLEPAAAAFLEDKKLDASLEGEQVRFNIDEQAAPPADQDGTPAG